MKSFSDFWTKLKENSLWFDQVSMKYGRKDIKDVAQRFYIDLLARPEEAKKEDYEAWRRSFQKWLMWEPDAPIAPQLQQVEETRPPMSDEERKKMEPVPKSDPRYQEHLNNWLAMLKTTEDNFKAPKLSKKQLAEEGDWIPKKDGKNYSHEDMIKSALTHMETMRRAKEKEYRAFNPKATDEEVEEYLNNIEFEF